MDTHRTSNCSPKPLYSGIWTATPDGGVPSARAHYARAIRDDRPVASIPSRNSSLRRLGPPGHGHPLQTPTACAELPREPIERRPRGSGTELSLGRPLLRRRKVGRRRLVGSSWVPCGSHASPSPHHRTRTAPHRRARLPQGNPVRWKSTSRGRAVILLVHSPLLGQALLPALPPLSDMLKFSGSLRVRQVTTTTTRPQPQAPSWMVLGTLG